MGLRRSTGPYARTNKNQRLPKAKAAYVRQRPVRLVPLWIALVGTVTTAVALLALLLWIGWWLLGARGFQREENLSSSTFFDLVKLAFAVVAGIGGVVALVVAYRKQQLAEGGELRETTKVHNDRFTAATGQLGSDSSAVKLAGVHALANLADDAPTTSLRQTCIDVLCAYLRMPYDLDPADLPTDATDEQVKDHAAARHTYRSLREVRHTIIRTVGAHLRSDAVVSWQGHNFDLTGVVFDGGDFRSAIFSGGRVDFGGAEFVHGTVDFAGAKFCGGNVNFVGAKFSGGAVSFTSHSFARYGRTIISDGTLDFRAAVFSGGTVDFKLAEFSGGMVGFTNAIFLEGEVNFANAMFSGGRIDFAGTAFSGGTVNFVHAKFSGGNVNFAHAGGNVGLSSAYYSPSYPLTTFSGTTFVFDNAEISAGAITFGGECSAGTISFRGTRFSGGTVDFKAVQFSGCAVTFSSRVDDGPRSEADLVASSASDIVSDLQPATICGARLDFQDTKFCASTVDFQRVTFSSGNVNFGGAEFSDGRVDFSHASFDGGMINFSSGGGYYERNRTQFSGGTVTFEGVSFSGATVDFSAAQGDPPVGLIEQVEQVGGQKVQLPETWLSHD